MFELLRDVNAGIKQRENYIFLSKGNADREMTFCVTSSTFKSVLLKVGAETIREGLESGLRCNWDAEG